MEEGRRQAYLAALGIPLWSARVGLPGAAAADGLAWAPFLETSSEEPVHVELPVPVPEPTLATPVPERVAEAPSTVPVSLSVTTPVAMPIPAVASPKSAEPAPPAPVTAVEFPVFQFWFKRLAEGWQLLIALGDVPDLSGREHALLAAIEEVLGGAGAVAPVTFRWPLNNNPAIPRDAQAASESVGAFLGRQRRAGDRFLLLGAPLQPYVQAALGDSLVVADSLAELLAEPRRKRALWRLLAERLA